MIRRMATSLRAKLLLAHLIVIGVGLGTLLITTNLTAPDIFARHMAQMHGGGMSGPPPFAGQISSDMAGEITGAFGQALTESLVLAGVAAFGTAVVISLILSKRVAGPIGQLARASRRIAAGHYADRVPARGQDELAQLALSFNDMASALENAERRRMELIGDVAHELRTPIATIEGNLEGLLDGVVLPSDRTWAKLLDEAGRLRRLVEDLQELSRAEAHQLSLSMRVVEPAPLVTAAVDRLSPDFAAKGLDVKVHLASGLSSIWADPDRMVQILTNLLTNALRYTATPGQVTVDVSRAGDFIEFRVTDSGIGIALEHIPHVFDRFYRVDKSRSRAFGGAGVGLTIARALVEAMEGHIWVESAGPGHGSVFTFDLPVAP